MKDSVRFNKLVDIVKFVLILSHGQPSVKWGFSANKNLLVENLQESSLIAQHLVLDHINANCFEPHTFPIDRNLIRSVKSFHQRYGHKQRILLETTIKDLLEESDILGYKDEKVSKLALVKLIVTKSNARKRAASDKQAELNACMERKRLLIEQKSAIDA